MDWTICVYWFLSTTKGYDAKVSANTLEHLAKDKFYFDNQHMILSLSQNINMKMQASPVT